MTGDTTKWHRKSRMKIENGNFMNGEFEEDLIWTRTDEEEKGDKMNVVSDNAG